MDLVLLNNDCKYSKKEAQYSDLSSAPAEHRCGICTEHQHSLTGEGVRMTCRVVEGVVKGMGGCRFFDKDLIKAAVDKIIP